MTCKHCGEPDRPETHRQAETAGAVCLSQEEWKHRRNQRVH